MNFLGGLIGNAAVYQTNQNNINDEEDRREKMRKLDSELRIKEQQVLSDLAEKRAADKERRVRDQNVSDAQSIKGAAGDTRVQRAQGLINADTGIQHTPDEVKQIIADPSWTQNYGAVHQTQTGADTEWKDGGLINQRTNLVPSTDRTRAQELADKADAAMGIGRIDMEKGFRDQGNLERQTASDEAKSSRDDKRLEQAAIKQAAWEANETEKRANDARKDETRQMQILAAINKSGNSNNETVKLLTQTRIDLGQKEHNLIVQKAADLKAAEMEMPEVKTKIEAEYRPKFEAISKERTQLTTDFNSLRKGLGLPDIKEEPKAKEPQAGKVFKYNPKTGKVE